MAGLTVTEKSHWRDRIAARIDKLIEQARAADPARFDRIARDARQQAIASLGLAAPYADLEAARFEERETARMKKLAQRSLLAALRSVRLDEVPDHISVGSGDDLGLPREVAEAIARRQAVYQEQFLAADPAGKAILQLEAEKEGLLDTVWLAVSPAQIKQLWAKVGNLLGDDQTALQRDALTIADPGRKTDGTPLSFSTTPPPRPPAAGSSSGPTRWIVPRRFHADWPRGALPPRPAHPGVGREAGLLQRPGPLARRDLHRCRGVPGLLLPGPLGAILGLGGGFLAGV